MLPRPTPSGRRHATRATIDGQPTSVGDSIRSTVDRDDRQHDGLTAACTAADPLVLGRTGATGADRRAARATGCVAQPAAWQPSRQSRARGSCRSPVIDPEPSTPLRIRAGTTCTTNIVGVLRRRQRKGLSSGRRWSRAALTRRPGLMPADAPTLSAIVVPETSPRAVGRLDVALNITIVGAPIASSRSCSAPGVAHRSLPVSDLLALAQPSAPQPDVRGARRARRTARCRRRSRSCKRQHPTTGVVIVAPTLDPALMLEAMRAGVNEWLDRAGHRRRTSKRPSTRVTAQPSQPRARARSSRSSAPRAASARRRSRSTSRRRSHAAGDEHDAADRPAPVQRRRGGVPRRRAAFSVVDALENTHRLDEAFFESLVGADARPASICSASAERGRSGRWTCGAIPHAARVRRAALPLHRARRAAVRRGRARRARRRRDDRHRRQPGAGDGAQRRPHGGRAAAALRQGRVTVVVSRYDTQAEIGHEDVERVVGVRRRAHVSRATTGRPRARSTRGGRSPSTTTTSWRRRSRPSRAIWLACAHAANRRRAARAGGLFGRLTGTALDARSQR